MVCGTPYLMPLKFPPPISVHRLLPTTTSHPRLSSPLFPTCTLSVPEKSSYLPTPSLFDPTSIVNSAPSGFHLCSSLSQLASSEHHSDRLPEPTPLLFASANLASILNTAPSITIPLFSPTTWEISSGSASVVFCLATSDPSLPSRRHLPCVTATATAPSNCKHYQPSAHTTTT
ncbi:hypothetical protein CTAM01_05370 [Colletotrichum tamarilloi]|uniref:Uncharacterized protein n=1 Tax=Colletotrichum tamarilloi TaxID=1209934 RepID=A0ABQ9RGA7_9PEZI|nr:uncharacterized protein CTAM01_05370 [Colletotrichum tamarilloi]KAK1502557.1 hypothetical protein CTAM01_05370 [Colletotrichum tamarilloi]